jgi:hypothetical protein
MDVETAIVGVVPTLAAFALIDAYTGFSALLFKPMGIRRELLSHVLLLLPLAIALTAWIDLSFSVSDAFLLKYYVDPRRHWFRIEAVPWILLADIILVILSIVVALVASLIWKRSVFLSCVAALLGNCGSIVWMILHRKSPR